jgi:hypothetical protein
VLFSIALKVKRHLSISFLKCGTQTRIYQSLRFILINFICGGFTFFLTVCMFSTTSAYANAYADRLELVILVSWLLKDFAWVLLFTGLAWPAALAAFLLEFHSLMTTWRIDSNAIRVHGLACLFWIFGNSLWMTSEFLWDSSSSFDKGGHSIYPWHEGPLVEPNPEAYRAGVKFARCILLTGLVMLLTYYVAAAMGMDNSRSMSGIGRIGSNPQEDLDTHSRSAYTEPLVWGFVTPKVYKTLFIGPWILKDIMWTCEWFYAAVACAVVVVYLNVDCFRRFRSYVSLAELLWVVANVIWLIAELGLEQPMLLPRLIAAACLLGGMSLIFRELGIACVHPEKEKAVQDDAIDERTSLIGTVC